MNLRGLLSELATKGQVILFSSQDREEKIVANDLPMYTHWEMERGRSEQYLLSRQQMLERLADLAADQAVSEALAQRDQDWLAQFRLPEP